MRFRSRFSSNISISPLSQTTFFYNVYMVGTLIECLLHFVDRWGAMLVLISGAVKLPHPLSRGFGTRPRFPLTYITLNVTSECTWVPKSPRSWKLFHLDFSTVPIPFSFSRVVDPRNVHAAHSSPGVCGGGGGRMCKTWHSQGKPNVVPWTKVAVV
jgi:hypothetical protein